MKDIPPPDYGHSTKYQFNTLENKGDVIFIHGDNLHAIRDAAYKYAKYHGIKFATRKARNGVNVYHAGALCAGES